MKRFACVYVWLLCLVLSVAAQEKVVKLKIVQTSDVHGNYYPYNFITRKDGRAVWHEYTLLWRKNANNIRRILFYSTTATYCRGNRLPITIII